MINIYFEEHIDKLFIELIRLNDEMSMMMEDSKEKTHFDSDTFDKYYGQIIINSGEYRKILELLKKENIKESKFVKMFDEYKTWYKKGKKFSMVKRLSPFYGDIKIPRKLKKKIKRFAKCHYSDLTNGERLWYYLEHKNLEYRNFLISEICRKELNKVKK